MECEGGRYKQREWHEAGVFSGDTCVGSVSGRTGERVNKISIVREKYR